VRSSPAHIPGSKESPARQSGCQLGVGAPEVSPVHGGSSVVFHRPLVLCTVSFLLSSLAKGESLGVQVCEAGGPEVILEQVAVPPRWCFGC